MQRCRGGQGLRRPGVGGRRRRRRRSTRPPTEVLAHQSAAPVLTHSFPLPAAASATRWVSKLGYGTAGSAVGTMAAAGAQGTAATEGSSASAGAGASASAGAGGDYGLMGGYGGLLAGQGMWLQWLQPFLEW